MPGPDLLDEFLGIVDRLSLSHADAAVLTGLSTHTIRLVRVARQLPQRERCRRQIEDFVRRNRGAQARSELRFSA